MATNFGMLLAAVMVAAVGGSVHLTMSVSLVSDLLPPDRVRYCLSPIVRQAAPMNMLYRRLLLPNASDSVVWLAKLCIHGHAV